MESNGRLKIAEKEEQEQDDSITNLVSPCEREWGIRKSRQSNLTLHSFASIAFPLPHKEVSDKCRHGFNFSFFSSSSASSSFAAAAADEGYEKFEYISIHMSPPITHLSLPVSVPEDVLLLCLVDCILPPFCPLLHHYNCLPIIIIIIQRLLPCHQMDIEWIPPLTPPSAGFLWPWRNCSLKYS